MANGIGIEKRIDYSIRRMEKKYMRLPNPTPKQREKTEQNVQEKKNKCLLQIPVTVNGIRI